MLTEIKNKTFSNGIVYLLKTEDGFPIETTDTFLPYYTKDCINEHTNELKSDNLGDRSERWMIGVSTMSGCPVHCKFCATGKLKKWRNLTSSEIFEQIRFILDNNRGCNTRNCKEFKINYTRMGEPFLNIDNVRQTIELVNDYLPHTKVHHYISTIGINGSDFSWIKDNITLQISLHSLDEKRRHELIPVDNLMSIEELGQIRTASNLKTTLNMTLVDTSDFDIDKLKKYFNKDYFFIKLSTINENTISIDNNLGSGIIQAQNLI